MGVFPLERRPLPISLTKADFFKVRTARNKNLVSKDEQMKFYNAPSALRLSVGSSVALALAIGGGPSI